MMRGRIRESRRAPASEKHFAEPWKSMLTTLRSKSGGIVAQIFIGLLALSFAIWGVSDILRVKPQKTLISAGETTISVDTYSSRFRQMLQRLSRQTGRGISPDDARQMGLDRQLLVQLIREAVLKEEVRRLNLSLPAEFIAARVRNMPQFKGPDGRFDAQRLRQALFSAGLSEAAFIAEERDALLGNGVMEAVTADMKAPKSLIERIYAWRNQARDAAFVEIVADEAKLPQPDEATLKKFYQQHQQQFTAPERRVIAVLALTPQAVLDQVRVSEDELKRLYESRKNSLNVPERRSAQQLRFDSEEAAQQALAALKAGEKSWEELLKERKLKPRDVELGPYEKKQFPEATLADAIFAGKQGEVVGPVKTPLGVFLAKVVKVEPGHTVSFEEAKPRLEKALKLERARDKVAELYDRIEEARASGQSLTDAAKSAGLKLVTTPPVALDGTGADGKPVAVPGGEPVIGAAFRSEPGADNDVVELGDDGFAWFDVKKVIPAGPIPFDQAKDKVLAAWKAQALKAALKRRLDTLKKKAEAGTPLARIAEELGGTLKRIESVKRNDARPDFPQVAVRALFAAKPGGLATAIAPDGRKAWLMRASERPLKKLDPASAEAQAIDKALSGGIAQDTAAEFIAALQQAYDVKINMKLWQQASGAGQ